MNKNKGISNGVLIGIIAIMTVVIAVLLVVVFKDKNKNKDKETTQEVVEVTASEEIKEDVTTAEEKAEQVCNVIVTKKDSWEANGKYCAGLTVTIKNDSDKELKNWSVILDKPDGLIIDGSWCGVFTENNDSIVIEPDMNSNGSIPADGEVNNIGMNISANSNSDIDTIINSAKLYVDGELYSESANAVEESDETTEDAKPDSEPAQTNNTESSGKTPVENHGRLSVKGTDIVDKNGDKYQLKGLSTHGIAWFPDYVNEDGFKTFRDDWGANLIRIAMYTDEYDGYCNGGDKEYLKGLVDKGVTAATNLGMYVIVDWHILKDNDPNIHKEEAKAYFEEMSAKYGSYENVIFEICNEPNGGTTWSDVKSYAEEIIPIIRKNAPDSIIIVGTPNWSQDVDIASDDPISDYDNIMYAVHFYAATHTDNIRSKVDTAISNGLPVFVSEFSICDASGNGAIDYNQADKWFELINKYNLSYAAWNISNKDETSSIIKSSCNKISGWSEEDLSETGVWIRQQILGN